jgi:hypothetical protein
MSRPGKKDKLFSINHVYLQWLYRTRPFPLNHRMIYTAIIWYVFTLSWAIKKWMEGYPPKNEHLAIPFLTLLAVVMIDIFVVLPSALNKEENRTALSILYSTPVKTNSIYSSLVSFGSRISVPHFLPYIVYYGIWACSRIIEEYLFLIHPATAYSVPGSENGFWFFSPFFGLTTIIIFTLYFFKLLISAGIIRSLTNDRIRGTFLMLIWVCFCLYICIICGMLASKICNIFYPGLFGSWYFAYMEIPDFIFSSGMTITAIVLAGVTEHWAIRMLSLKRQGAFDG